MTTTGYNSVVCGIPIAANTIYTGLKVTEGPMKQLGQDITSDYVWFTALGHFVIRLGGFHILKMFGKVLGKRYGDAGLMDLFIELKVFGPNAAKVIMTGKKPQAMFFGSSM